MSKKLIILGGNPETGALVEVALSMGIHTIVMDPNPNAPAKKKATESYDVDVFNIEKIVEIAKEKNIDGVLVGVADILVKPYKEICKKLNIPCYATKKSVEAFCSKDGYKKYSNQYNVQDIPGIYITRNSKIEKPKNLDYPLMIKPVDNGAGVGMKICRDDKDYIESVERALEFSKKGVVLVERYMDCEDMAAYYTFKDGEPYLSATYDRITTKKQGDSSPVGIGAIYPSKHTNIFVKNIHPKLYTFFKALDIENGILNLQFFVEDDNFYSYDPGFRLQGEAPHIHLLNINGFDHREMLINFALSGNFGDNDFSKKNDYLLNGKIACTVWVLLNKGRITNISGLNEIKSHKNVKFVMQRFEKGDVVKNDWVGTERQVFARIYIVSNSINEMNDTVDNFKSKLQITDSNNKNMIIEWIKPFNSNDYKF